MRIAALVLLLVAPAALSGCLGNDEPQERLAQELPTGEVLVVPPTSTRAPGPVFNTSDPGYRVDAPWHVGDGWDYESNQSHIRRVRIVDQRLVSGSTRYLVETRDSTVNVTGEVVTRAWVDSKFWLKLNETFEDGASARYDPGVAQRFYRNASFTYNATHLDAAGRADATASVTVFSRLYPLHQTLQFKWGYVEAKRVEHLATVRTSDGNRTQSTTIHWVHRDYLNDVQFQLPSGETYKIVAAKAGDFRRGILAT